MNVQHRLAVSATDGPSPGDLHVVVMCLACGSMHFVNSLTGKLLCDGDTEGGGPGHTPRT